MPHKLFFQLDERNDQLLAAFGIRPTNRYTPQQLSALKNLYLTNKYPTKEEKNDLAMKLGITEHRISVWFKHQREKDKSANSF